MNTDYRDRFGLSHHPFDKKFLHEHPVETAGSACLARRAEWLESQRGIRLVTGVSGIGKTALLLNILRKLPSHRYQVVYLEDSGASTNDIFRGIAYELGLQPAFRRSALWRDLKHYILKLDEENDQQVVLVFDDAHRLPGELLKSLGAFMNFAFDSHELLTVWLVGDSDLLRILSLNTMRHLATRVRLKIHLEPLNREEFERWVVCCLEAAGCTRQIVTDIAMDAAFHLSRGVPRSAAKLFDLSLRLCHEQERDIVCENVIELATKEVML